MSFVPNFSVAQEPQAPNLVFITDTSTGSDVLITERRVYVRNAQGNYVVPDGTNTQYVVWDINTNSITLNILKEDIAATVKVEWLNSLGAVLYEKENNYCFSQYNQQFLYFLIQMQSQTYRIVQDTEYWSNLSTYWVNIISAIKSVEVGNDIFASQECLNRATNMKDNQSIYF